MTTELADSGLAKILTRAHSHCAVHSPSNDMGLRLGSVASRSGEVRARFDYADACEGFSGIIHRDIVISLINGA